MATTNYAFQTFANQLNQGLAYINNEAKLLNLARVIHIVYGPNIPGTNISDKYYTGPLSLGTITYQLFGVGQDSTSQSAGNPPAKPLYSTVKKLPVKNEIVQIIVGKGIMNDDKEQPQYYYTYPLGIWSHAHHNAFPDMGDYGKYVNESVQTYQQSQFSRTPDNPDPKTPVNMPLGPGFIERPYIKTLREFPGDVILEGRWGNSIRFGSTTDILKDQNNWSSDSAPGNPITIIRNGQGRQLDQEGYIPAVENINRDPSSIYLTQGQKIIIDDIQNNFSLASLGINLQTSITLSIPIQQSLTSYESLSPTEQDQVVSDVTNPETPPERTSDLPSSTTSTEVQTTTQPPTTSPNITQPTAPNVKGNYLRDYTNTVGNNFELYSIKKGFTTTLYAYKKETGVLVKTGYPSSTASIEVLIKEIELSLADNSF